jgi:hypothetical protein
MITVLIPSATLPRQLNVPVTGTNEWFFWVEKHCWMCVGSLQQLVPDEFEFVKKSGQIHVRAMCNN